MKKMYYNFVLLLTMSTLVVGCDDSDSAEPIPVAPILKEIVMPSESTTFPGSIVTISGKGFDFNDILTCKSLSGEADFTPEVVEVNNQAILISVPKSAAGTYEVSVQRSGLTTILDERLRVAYMLVIDNLQLPTSKFAPGAAVTIKGNGFENGDQIVLTSDGYPAGHSLIVNGSAVTEGLSFTLPDKAYGVNSITVKRGKRQGRLGDIKVAVSVGMEIGGGVVYYISDEGIHGLVSAKANVGTTTESWGPGVAKDIAVGTSADIYKGKENTKKIIAKMPTYRSLYASWVGRKSAAEYCDDYAVSVDGVNYNDWFLPSKEELIKVFEQKNMLATKGATLAANNYWSSTEGDANECGWSAYYVNFYEPVNLVLGYVDKEGWKIGIRPIRQF